MDFNNKPEQGLGGNYSTGANTYEGNQTFNNNNTYDSNQTYGNAGTYDSNQTYGNAGTYDNNQTYGNAGTYNSNQIYNGTNSYNSNQTFGDSNNTYGNSMNTAAGNGMYTSPVPPVNNTYGGYNGGTYGTPPTPPGDFERFNSFSNMKETPVSTWEWIWSYLVMCIPCVGLVMIFVWAFGSSAKRSKSNLCKAMLIITAVMIVIMLILYGSVFAAMIASMKSDSYAGILQNIISRV